ncbi:ABC transporter substrate-binding protein [Malaciobacter mytili LMG 24559]|uniref:ABC transporter substrate-binding protein n=1 Tax=Malaciobacter mytili LMG 24559 TaxID=1032238 RepID=A0AAX2AG50_9BACT|nr:ABC transporter substrate-binding protein [Malaciobacter mytili]AXH15985.1 nitrate/sulfonate/bicarbonate ABC transporter, periplasmic substrate-binding protein [Malaciobacter mytili LMG 24559]RXK13663.1 ABC transporter substrate-binding protein [Malaciobacter mytili LMG 24559]
MKKSLLFSFVFLLSLFAKDENKIVVAGPFASVSHPIMHMIENDALKDLNKKIEFKLWKNPDELKAMILNSNIDFIALPTNVASNLYNKGVDLKLLNVSVWGILAMISRDANLKTLKDFKGKEIAIPFRADMPDIIFQELTKKYGLDPKKDFKIQYVTNPIDAMQMLILRRVDHALLAEPAISIALRKTDSFPIKIVAPELYRSVDLQEEWGKLFNTKSKVPQAGIAYLGNTKGKEELINRFLQEYEKSLAWYKQNPQKAATLVVKTLPMLEEKGLADSIKYVKLESISAFEAKEDLEFFFTILKNSNAKLIGGNLPNENLYYNSN